MLVLFSRGRIENSSVAQALPIGGQSELKRGRSSFRMSDVKNEASHEARSWAVAVDRTVYGPMMLTRVGQ